MSETPTRPPEAISPEVQAHWREHLYNHARWHARSGYTQDEWLECDDIWDNCAVAQLDSEILGHIAKVVWSRW